MQNFLRAFCAQAQRRAVRGDDLHAAVAEFRVRVPHAARELDKLTNVPDEQRAVKTEFLAEFQAVTDEVRRQHRRLRVKPDKIADVVCAVVAGRKEDVVRAVLAPLPQFHVDGVKQCLLAHRLDDAGRAQNGDAALNAEARVEGLFRERLALRRRDRHVNAAVVSDEHADLAHVLFDHFSRHGVDGHLAHRLVEPRLRHAANALAAVDGHAGCGRFSHRGKNERTARHVGVVAAVLLNGAARLVREHLNVQHFEVQLDAFGRLQADGLLPPARQQHPRRSLGRRGGARAGCVAEAQALTVLYEIFFHLFTA